MVRKSVPLVRQVIEEILSGIRTGDLTRAKGTLPSEAELSQRFNVSRATIREALSRLEQAGVIIRKHGVGTFVASPAPLIGAGLEELVSLETLAQRIGLATRMGQSAIEERAATPTEADRLRISPAHPVLSVARVILTDKRPVAYLIDIVPTWYLRQTDLGDVFNGSVLDLIIRKGAPALSHSYTDIAPEAADEEMARKLQIQCGDPLLKLEAQLYALDGKVVDYSLSHFVPGFFRFHVMRRVVTSSNGIPAAA